jgi:type I restriction enzyme R subunit
MTWSIYQKQVVFILMGAHRSFGEAQKNPKKKFKKYYPVLDLLEHCTLKMHWVLKLRQKVFGRELHS